MNENFVFGALFSKPDVRDYVASTKLSEFPEEFELAMPKVKNQGAVSSCVAHSLATIVEYFNKKETGRYREMSTGYIYGNRRLSLHKGSCMYTRDALRTVAKYGDVPNMYFPVNIEVPDAIERFEKNVGNIEDKGYKFKFKEYFKLKNEKSIKTSLMENGPVVFAMTWYDDIDIVDGIMNTDYVKTAKTSGHCMVIYGWNDIGWKVQNSWGTNWGDKGHMIVPYDVPFKEAWGVKDAESTSNLVIKKPFKTEFGAKIAKVLNNAILFVYNIFHKE